MDTINTKMVLLMKKMVTETRKLADAVLRAREAGIKQGISMSRGRMEENMPQKQEAQDDSREHY